jgi:hypothetical protein
LFIARQPFLMFGKSFFLCWAIFTHVPKNIVDFSSISASVRGNHCWQFVHAIKIGLVKTVEERHV